MPQPDVIRRFAATPLEAVLGLSGLNIRLETNCQPVADWLQRALAPCAPGIPGAPDFTLRVVAESDDDCEFEIDPAVYRLSHNGLSFISLGYRSFLACDHRARRCVSFVSQTLMVDEKRFAQYFLPALISLLTESIECTD